MKENINQPAKTSEILVFKTSLQTPVEFRFIFKILNDMPGIREWSVDLDDWEKILRIETVSVKPHEIISTLQNVGIYCKQLAINELSCKEL